MIIDFEKLYSEKKFKQTFSKCSVCDKHHKIYNLILKGVKCDDVFSIDCVKCNFAITFNLTDETYKVNTISFGWADISRSYELHVIDSGIWLYEYNKKSKDLRMFSDMVNASDRRGRHTKKIGDSENITIHRLTKMYRDIEKLRSLF